MVWSKEGRASYATAVCLAEKPAMMSKSENKNSRVLEFRTATLDWKSWIPKRIEDPVRRASMR
eukprot:6334694-Pyramimonas_sp.AAC.1